MNVERCRVNPNDLRLNKWWCWWLFIPTRLQYFTCILEMWCLNPIYHWQQKEFVECFVHVDVDFQIFLYVKKCIILVVWCEKIHLTWGFLIVSKSTHWLISLWFYCTCGKCQFSCVVSLPSPSCIPELAQKFWAISIHKITGHYHTQPICNLCCAAACAFVFAFWVFMIRICYSSLTVFAASAASAAWAEDVDI